MLPPPIGWAAVAVLAMIGLDAVVGLAAATGPILWIVSIALLTALVAWLWILSSTLLSRAIGLTS